MSSHLRFTSLLFFFLAITACNPSDIVQLKGVDLTTTGTNSQIYINMEAVVSIGNLKFPDVELPLVNSKENGKELGQLDFQNLADGTNRLYLSLNYDEAMKLDSNFGKTLPNDRDITGASIANPVTVGTYTALSGTNTTLAGANTSHILLNTAQPPPNTVQPLTSLTLPLIGIPFLEHSRIYIGGDLDQEITVGVALALPEFDSAFTQTSSPLNILFSYPFSTEVNGVAGLFSGPKAGQNGIAIFVRKNMKQTNESPVLNLSPSPTGGEEINKLDAFTLLKINRLLQKKDTVPLK